MMLEGKDLRSRETEPWVARIRYAYAEALLAGGRTSDALEWFHRAAAVDATSATDAAERLLEMEGMTLIDAEADDEDAEAESAAEDGEPTSLGNGGGSPPL
jgi:hypothetical protein